MSKIPNVTTFERHHVWNGNFENFENYKYHVDMSSCTWDIKKVKMSKILFKMVYLDCFTAASQVFPGWFLLMCNEFSLVRTVRVGEQVTPTSPKKLLKYHNEIPRNKIAHVVCRMYQPHEGRCKSLNFCYFQKLSCFC